MIVVIVHIVGRVWQSKKLKRLKMYLFKIGVQRQ